MGRASTLIAAIGVATGSYCFAGGVHPANGLAMHGVVSWQAQRGSSEAQRLLLRAIDEYRRGRYQMARQLLDEASRLPNLTDKERQFVARYRGMMQGGAPQATPVAPAPPPTMQPAAPQYSAPQYSGPNSGASSAAAPAPRSNLSRLPDGRKQQEYNTRLAQARKLVDAGRLDEAEQLLRQAEMFVPAGPNANGAVQSLRREIQLARGGTPTAPLGGSVTNETSRQQALAHLRQGRAHLAAGRFGEAHQAAQLARQTGATFGLLDDTPTKLERDLQAAHAVQSRQTVEPETPNVAAAPQLAPAALQVPTQRPTGSDRVVRKQAAQHLSQARKLLGQGDHHSATEIANRVAGWGIRYSVWSDTPDKVARAATALASRNRRSPSTRTTRNRAEVAQAKTLVREARQALRSGNIVEAEQKARQAQQFEVRYGWFDDRPEKILADVERVTGKGAIQPASGQTQAPANPAGVAQTTPQPQRLAPIAQPTPPRAVPATAAPTTAAQLPPTSSPSFSTTTTTHTAPTAPGPVAPQQLTPTRTLTDTVTTSRPWTQRQPANQPVTLSPRGTELIEVSPYNESEYSQQSKHRVIGPNKPTLSEPPKEVMELLNEARTGVTPEVNQVGYTRGNMDNGASPQQKLQWAQKLFEVGNYGRAKALASEAAQSDPALAAAAEDLSARADVMQQAVMLRLFEAGEAALKKQEYSRALGFFRQIAASDAELDPTTQQKLRGYLRDLPQSVQQAEYTGSRDGHVVQAGAQDPRPSQGALTADDGEDDMDDAAEKEKVRFQQLVNETSRSVQAARSMLESNPDKSLDELDVARERVANAELPENMRAVLTRRVDAAIRFAKQEKQRFDFESVQKQSQVAMREQRQREMAVERQKEEEVEKLIEESQALMGEGRYADAERVARRAVEVDPDNPATAAVHYKAKIERQLQIQRELSELKNERSLATLESVDDSAIPYGDDRIPIRYPGAQDWEDLTRSRKDLMRRLEERAKSPLELEIERRLQEPTSFSFNETPLSEVVNFLRDFTGVNIVLDQQALVAEGLSSNLPVTLKLERVPLRSALNVLLGQLNLAYAIENDVLSITTPLKQRSELITKIYSVGDLVVQVPNLAPNTLGALGTGALGVQGNGVGSTMGSFMGSPGSPMPSVGLGQLDDQQQPYLNPFYQGAYGDNRLGGQSNGGIVQPSRGQAVDFDALIDLIEGTIEPDSWADVGGEGTIEEFQPNLSLVISATQAVHEEIVDLLAQLRRLQDLQVSVEVKFITLTEDFFERIGIDFDVNIQSNSEKPLQDFGSIAVPGNAATGTLPIRDLTFDDHDDDTAVGLNGPLDILGAAPLFANDLKIPFRTGGFGVGRPGDFVPGQGLSFGVAFLSDIEVFLFLEAAQNSNRANVLLAPKVTLFNGATAFTFSGTQEPFVTQLTPVVQAGAVSFDPQVSQVFNGSGMVVQAVISADRRYVRMTILPIFNNITGERRFQIQGGAAGGGGVVGGGTGVVAATELVVPIVATNFVITTVSVPDGGTVVMGGLKTKNEVRNELGTPILNKLPYVNRLFMNTGISSASQSLLIMVTPRIIIQEEEEELLGKTLAF